MDNLRSTEIKVGIVTLIAIFLLIIGIILGKGISLSVNSYELKFRFANSGGITPSSPVFINGVKKGTITSIKSENGSVLIKAQIEDISGLRKDANARISILEIIGGKKIDIFTGTSQEKFDLSQEIKGITAVDLSDLVTLAGDITDDAKILLKRIDTLVASANNVFADNNFTQNLKSSVQNASEMSNELNRFVKLNINDLQTTVSNLKTLTNDLKLAVKKNEPRLDTVMTKVDDSLTDTKKLLTAANSAIASAELIIADLNKITQEVRNGKGFANKIIYDKDFSSKLDSMTTALGLLVSQLQQYGINVNVRLGTRP